MKILKKLITFITCLCIVASIPQLSHYGTNSDISTYGDEHEYPDIKV